MTALQLARRFAADIRREHDIKASDPYGPKVRNAREAREHGWMPDALATVTFEDSGCDLIEMVGRWVSPEPTLYFECHSSYMVGVYRA